jgi:2-iminobutanoate/2-iminopropanoate deaminase
MSRIVLTPASAPPPAGPYSHAIKVGDWLYLAGQGGFDPSTGKMISDSIEEQTEQTLKNLASLLNDAGYELTDVVSCLCHLSDLSDFATFNAVYGRFFTDEPPVRTTVQAALVAGMVVEITAVAYRADAGGGS